MQHNIYILMQFYCPDVVSIPSYLLNVAGIQYYLLDVVGIQYYLLNVVGACSSNETKTHAREHFKVVSYTTHISAFYFIYILYVTELYTYFIEEHKNYIFLNCYISFIDWIHFTTACFNYSEEG